jgi:hypothetical protein
VLAVCLFAPQSNPHHDHDHDRNFASSCDRPKANLLAMLEGRKRVWLMPNSSACRELARVNRKYDSGTECCDCDLAAACAEAFSSSSSSSSSISSSTSADAAAAAAAAAASSSSSSSSSSSAAAAAAAVRRAEALKSVLVCDLEPGDVLYIPPYWFHQVSQSE